MAVGLTATSSQGRRRETLARTRRGLRRVFYAATPIALLTAAATAAWLIALQIGDHSDPFFAPIAVVVALSSPVGERGSNAIRLLLGVIIGITTGELTVLVLGGGYGRLALAVFVAMVVARLLRGPRLVLVQAAAGAILTVAAANGEAGVDRLMDAAIGAAVALLFSQVLLSPEPVALVRRATAQALGRMAGAVALVAEALDRRDDALADEAMKRLRDIRDELSELARLRKASSRVARHSAIWHSRIEPVVRENENAGHLDLLGASCVLLARTVVYTDFDDLTVLAPNIHDLARALAEVAADPGDRGTRQDAADTALSGARRLATMNLPQNPAVAATLVAVRMVTIDVMTVAGVDPEEAAAAVWQGSGDLRVAAPPTTPRLPWTWRRRRGTRH